MIHDEKYDDTNFEIGIQPPFPYQSLTGFYYSENEQGMECLRIKADVKTSAEKFNKKIKSSVYDFKCVIIIVGNKAAL